MRRKNFNNFVIGLTIGGLLALLFWYWQKSTSAEDGALELLDRLALAEKKLDRLRLNKAQNRAVLAGSPSPAKPEKQAADDLTRIKGIGPMYAARLQEAGIHTFAQLTAVTPQDLAHILQTNEKRAADILAATKAVLH